MLVNRYHIEAELLWGRGWGWASGFGGSGSGVRGKVSGSGFGGWEREQISGGKILGGKCPEGKCLWGKRPDGKCRGANFRGANVVGRCPSIRYSSYFECCLIRKFANSNKISGPLRVRNSGRLLYYIN